MPAPIEVSLTLPRSPELEAAVEQQNPVNTSSISIQFFEKITSVLIATNRSLRRSTRFRRNGVSMVVVHMIHRTAYLCKHLNKISFKFDTVKTSKLLAWTDFVPTKSAQTPSSGGFGNHVQSHTKRTVRMVVVIHRASVFHVHRMKATGSVERS